MLIHPHARGPKLAAGSFGSRLDAMGTQPAPTAGGSVLATYALNLGLWPRPGPTGVHRLYRDGRATRRVAGAIVPERGTDPYRSTLGLAAPSACAPAVLPDGRVLMSDEHHRYRDQQARDEALEEEVVRLLSVLRPDGPCDQGDGPGGDADHHRAREEDQVHAAPQCGDVRDPALQTFTFECADVFASGGASGAPAPEPGLRLKFFAALPRFDRAGGDTAVLIREVPVGPRGAIRAGGLPAGVPMFEQLARADGTPLLTAHGPAHVPGLNAGSPGAVTRCIGCHAGHSRLPVIARR